MKIVKFEKNSPEWLEFKRSKIGGSRSKASKQLTRGTDRTPELFWTLVGEALTNPLTGDAGIARGHTLEADGIKALSEAVGLPFDDNPGVWVSDADDSVIISPDGAEVGELPTYGAEIKCLGEGKHFKYLYKFKNNTGTAIEVVPNESKASYKEQCIQAFSTNPALEKYFFALYNPDAIYEDHRLVYVEIKREDITELVREQLGSQINLMKQVREIVSELVGERF